MATLAEGLLQELDRNQELLRVYESIGPPGAFGAMMIRNNIRTAQAAMVSGDCVAMIGIFQKLKSNE